MSYQLAKNGSVFRLADGAFIPPDEGNTDYQVFLAWVEEGNVAECVPEPSPAPELTAAEKLKAIGLSVADLQALLAQD